MLRRKKGDKRVRKSRHHRIERGHIPSLASVIRETEYQFSRTKTNTGHYKNLFRDGIILICGICKKQILYINEISTDHIVPKSRGGTNAKSNLQPAHKICNHTKGNNLPDEI